MVPRSADESPLRKPPEGGTPNGGSARQAITFHSPQFSCPCLRLGKLSYFTWFQKSSVPIRVNQWLNPSPSISIPIPIAISNGGIHTTRSEFLVYEDSSAGFSRRGSGAMVPQTVDESTLRKPPEGGTPNGGSARQAITFHPPPIFVPMPTAWQAFVLYVVPKIISAHPCQSVVEPFPVDFDPDPDSDFERGNPHDPFGVPRLRGFIRRLQPTRLRSHGSADGR